MTDCIIFKGSIAKDGYGILWRRLHGETRGRTRRAHRLAWERQHGPIPKGLCVLHKCDTPLCVNVEHLFLGSPADNSKDMMTKGRVAHGVSHGSAKLDDHTAHWVRKLGLIGRMRHVDIGTAFGVRKSTVQAIASGRHWGHLY